MPIDVPNFTLFLFVWLSSLDLFELWFSVSARQCCSADLVPFHSTILWFLLSTVALGLPGFHCPTDASSRTYWKTHSSQSSLLAGSICGATGSLFRGFFAWRVSWLGPWSTFQQLSTSSLHCRWMGWLGSYLWGSWAPDPSLSWHRMHVSVSPFHTGCTQGTRCRTFGCRASLSISPAKGSKAYQWLFERNHKYAVIPWQYQNLQFWSIRFASWRYFVSSSLYVESCDHEYVWWLEPFGQTSPGFDPRYNKL